MSKQLKKKFRAAEMPEGELHPAFFDDDGEPLEFGLDSPPGTQSVTYVPDSFTVYEDDDKTKFKDKIKDKTIKEKSK